MLRGFLDALNNFLTKPKRVLLSCLFFSFLLLVMDGSLFRLWELKQSEKHSLLRISNYKKEIKKLNLQLQLTNKPSFVEAKVRDHFDLVGADEMVFVFTSE